MTTIVPPPLLHHLKTMKDISKCFPNMKIMAKRKQCQLKILKVSQLLKDCLEEILTLQPKASNLMKQIITTKITGMYICWSVICRFSRRCSKNPTPFARNGTWQTNRFIFQAEHALYTPVWDLFVNLGFFFFVLPFCLKCSVQKGGTWKFL